LLIIHRAGKPAYKIKDIENKRFIQIIVPGGVTGFSNLFSVHFGGYMGGIDNCVFRYPLYPAVICICFV